LIKKIVDEEIVYDFAVEVIERIQLGKYTYLFDIKSFDDCYKDDFQKLLKIKSKKIIKLSICSCKKL
jgi:hypothetical protein